MSFNLRTPHVNVSNSREFIYIKGDANTDGSIRLLPESVNQIDVQFELRTSGAWNPTGIQVSAATVNIGHEVKISGAGDWMVQSDADGDSHGVVPHIEFETLTGTPAGAEMHFLRLSPEVTIVVQSDDSAEFTGTDFKYTNSAAVNRLVSSLTYRTGSTAASAPVKYTLSTGNYASLGGQILYDYNYPANLFPANSDATLPFVGWVEVEAGEPVFIELESINDFSIKTNAAGLIPYTALTLHAFTEDHTVSYNVGMDNIITSYITQDAMVDVNGNLMTIGWEGLG